jgi:hypothetical protein
MNASLFKEIHRRANHNTAHTKRWNCKPVMSHVGFEFGEAKK